MLISVSKLQQDLVEYLKTATPAPAAPVQRLTSMVCAVYSCVTPHGVTYIHLNVGLEENFTPEIIDTYNQPDILATEEHKSLLTQVEGLRAHLLTSMEPHSIYMERSYPHRLGAMLNQAGIWLADKTGSVFSSQ